MLQVPSILFTASHIMAALTLGVPSCLVMDCGYYETVVLPVSLLLLLLDLKHLQKMSICFQTEVSLTLSHDTLVEILCVVHFKIESFYNFQ